MYQPELRKHVREIKSNIWIGIQMQQNLLSKKWLLGRLQWVISSKASNLILSAKYGHSNITADKTYEQA